MQWIVEMFEKSLENRAAFLAPYHDKFLAAKQGSVERAKIIDELCKIESSHIKLDWIIDEIVFWQNHYKCRDFLEMVFIRQKKNDGTKRCRQTEGEHYQSVKDFFLYFEIERIKKDNQCSTRKACSILANKQADNPNPIYPVYSDSNAESGIDDYIRKRYNRHAKIYKEKQLPNPYFGKDVTISDDGFIVIHAARPGARIEFPGKDGAKPFMMAGKWHFKTPIRITPRLEPEKS